MTRFDDYNRQNWGRSYSENVQRFAERAGLSEHDVDDMQRKARDDRNEYYRRMDEGQDD